jgi:argininosuccinate synthase
MRVLNLLGGRNGIGRVDIVENRFVGMKSRGVYETPGGTILLAAHRDLETLTVDREVDAHPRLAHPEIRQLVYNGFWFAPEREAIQALVTETQKTVSGEVRLKLYKGNVMQRRPALAAQHVFRGRRHHGRRPGGSLQPGRRHRLHRLNALRLKASAASSRITRSVRDCGWAWRRVSDRWCCCWQALRC